MLDPTWFPDIRRELYQQEPECLQHIANNTFDEDVFEKCLNNFNALLYIELKFNADSKYSTSNLEKIASYYNDRTYTTNYYNPHTGVKGTQEPHYHYSPSSETTISSNDSSTPRKKMTKQQLKVEIKEYAIAAGIFFLIALLVRSCAHGEEITDKYVLVDSNNKKIEFMDNNFVNYDINNEVINPDDYNKGRLK